MYKDTLACPLNVITLMQQLSGAIIIDFCKKLHLGQCYINKKKRMKALSKLRTYKYSKDPLLLT